MVTVRHTNRFEIKMKKLQKKIFIMFLVRHMNSEHNAYYGLEYLLASCTMSEEERGAVREVTRYVFVVAYLLMIFVVVLVAVREVTRNA